MPSARDLEGTIKLTRSILADVRNLKVKTAVLKNSIAYNFPQEADYAASDAETLLADYESQVKGLLNALLIEMIEKDAA